MCQPDKHAAKDDRERPREAVLENSAYSLADYARVTLTNTSEFTEYECFRALILSKITGAYTKSVTVCTGDMKAHSSVTLDAPYRTNEVHSLCDGKPDGYGNRHLDWSLCEFDVYPSTAFVNGALKVAPTRTLVPASSIGSATP